MKNFHLNFNWNLFAFCCLINSNFWRPKAFHVIPRFANVMFMNMKHLCLQFFFSNYYPYLWMDLITFFLFLPGLFCLNYETNFVKLVLRKWYEYVFKIRTLRVLPIRRKCGLMATCRWVDRCCFFIANVYKLQLHTVEVCACVCVFVFIADEKPKNVGHNV